MADDELVEKKEEVSEVREHLALSCVARIQWDRFGLGSE
jgi:ubiquitin C-terminal hydrolase